MLDNNKYLWMYIGTIFMISWGIAMGFIAFPNALVPLFGQLNMTHPLTIFALYTPSIAGIGIYYRLGGFNAVKWLFLKLVPRREDLWWFPVLFLVWGVFVLFVRFGVLFLGDAVPPITLNISQLIVEAFWNFIRETGLLGGLFGWVGFLLPFLQGKLKNNVYAGLLTGFIFGLWVLPGYLLSSFGETSSYPLYVMQLMAFFVFTSYYFNDTQGNLSLYLFMFWLTATGSHVQLYYFNAPTQLLQTVFFILASITVHVFFKKTKKESAIQVLPNFIRQELS